MARPIIRIKRSTTAGNKPTTGQLQLGELALNTSDAELYARRERVGFNPDVVRIGAGATVTNVLYVTKDGDDNNTGKKLGDAKATIKGAVAAAEEGTVIKVSAGVYVEDNPIALPAQSSIVGDNLREVSVQCANPGDLFWVSNGNYVTEMSFIGPSNPGGAIFAFNPDVVGYFDQSPYIQNCTNFIPGTIGLKIDGLNAVGPLKSMVLDSYTQYNPGGVGASMTNEGYAQLVSLFTICDDVSVFCGSGAACDLTNSNSSFGDFALIADGVGPNKFTGTIVEATTSTNEDTFVVDISTPKYNITDAVYDHVTGILTAYTDVAHGFEVGVGITLAGLGFTCSSDGGVTELQYPTGNFGYVFEPFIVAPGRYYDAYNSIQANKKEIQDKALAAIALNHPDFYFPGDEQTTDRSRYYDSYRLIKQNEREIADKAVSKLPVGFPLDFYFPDEPQISERSRFYDGSGLIQRNRQEIVDKALASIAVGFPSDFYFPDEAETNEQSRFYDGSSLIQRNKQEIIDKSLAAISLDHPDFYFPDDEQTNAISRFFDSYRLIQKNKDVIVSAAFTAAVNNPEFAAFDFFSVMDKCKRDTGLFIDAVSTDVFTGGNNYSTAFTLFYFDADGNPTTNGVLGEESESVYVFDQARDLMKSAITNTLVGAAYSDLTITADPVTGSNVDPASCADVQTNIDTLVGIVTVSIGAGNTTDLPTGSELNYGYFNQAGIGTTSSPGGFTCARDLGFFVEAIATDVFTGGNKYSREFVLQYFENGTPISGGLDTERDESVTAFVAAGDYAKKAVTNQLNVKNYGISAGPAEYAGGGGNIPVLESGNENACIDVQQNINNLVGIVTVSIGAGNTSDLTNYPENLGISTTNTCARDLGYLVEAVATDVFIGGNKYTRDFTLQYFDADTGLPIADGLLGEESESVYAFNSVGLYARKAVTNQLNIKNLGLSPGPADYQVGGSDIPVLPSGNANACIDVQSNIDTLVAITTNVIGVGNTTFLSTFNENLGISTTNKCIRDTRYFVDAIATDLFIDGTYYAAEFTKQYADNVGLGTNALEGEEVESVYVFRQAAEFAKKAITNQLNIQDLTITADPSPESGISSNKNPTSCTNVRDAIDTLTGIVTSVIISGDINDLPSVINQGSYSAGSAKCRRDIGYFIDYISEDVRDLKVKETVNALKFYFNDDGTLDDSIETEIDETVTAFEAAGEYMKLAINNQLYNKNFDLIIDPETGSNNDENSCSNVKSYIDNIVGIVTTVLIEEDLSVAVVSFASTVFSARVGPAPFEHYYTSGGTVNLNSVRPFDGQVVYFGELYYEIKNVVIGSGGTGYSQAPTLTFESPEVPWGIPGQAIAEISSKGVVENIELVSSGRGYRIPPKVTASAPQSGINTAVVSVELTPVYYAITKATPVSSAGITTITIGDNLPYTVGVGTAVPFFKQSRVLASGHSLEYIGTGPDITKALPQNGGVPIPEQETDSRNGGLVVFTSTDQAGNFKIGDGIIINQNTGSITGDIYSKSLFATLTPFILALGGE